MLQAHSQDWPNLARYQEENTSITPGSKSVIFMGNSITEGWVQMVPEFFEKNNFLGRGIGGQTTPQMLIRFRQDVINLKPKVVVILAGTNDIAGNTGPMSLAQIMDNLKGMAELAEANGIKVILCSVLPAYAYTWVKDKQPNIDIPKLNSMIETYCNNSGHHYLDYFSAMVGDKNDLRNELTYDGVHPDKAGYQVMIPIVEKAILQVLGE
jgi:lysophospholipase L1-like esterase